MERQSNRRFSKRLLLRLRLLLVVVVVVVTVVVLAPLGVAAATANDASLEAECARFSIAQNVSLQLQWQLLSSGAGGPFTRISHTSVALSSPPRVLIIGGIEYESAQPTVRNTTIVYDPQSDLFTLPVDQIQSTSSAAPTTTSNTRAKDDVFTSPASRAEHASALVSSSGSTSVVLLFGGQNKEFLNDLWRMCVGSDSAQARWDQFTVPAGDAVSLAAAPSPRIGHSMAVVYENASVTGAIVYGGLSQEYTEVEPQLHLALIAKSSVEGAAACGVRNPRVHWRVLRTVATSTTSGDTQQPVARAYHAIAPVSRLFNSTRMSCLILYGGRSSRTNTIYGDVWRLCPVLGDGGRAALSSVESQLYQWEQLSPLGSRGPGPRYGAAIAFIDEGKLAIAGGSYAFPNDFLSDLWEFNVNATQWLSLRFDHDFTPPRRGHSIALLDDRLFLFGGRDRYSVVTKRMQVATYAAPYCASGLKITLCEATSSYVCVPCPAGYFLEPGTRKCLPCGAGSYSSEGSAVCTKCPTGTYNPLTAQTSQETACMACPAGSFSSVEGAALASACLPCSAGTFAAAVGTSVCANCVPGSFSKANATSCTPCAVGEWSSSAAAQCSKCAAGSYNPRNGSAVCFPCPRGFYSELGRATCDACPNNTFSVTVATAGIVNCASCPPFTFTHESGQSSCEYCAAGTSLRDAVCQPCPQGHYSGSALTGGGCVPCPLHSYSNVSTGTGASQCVSCPRGLRTLAAGAISSSDCQTCAMASSSPTEFFDGSSCRLCGSGSFLSSSDARLPPFCEACAPGTYTSSAAEASLSSGCQSCPSMAVAAEMGASTCVACAANSFAMAAWHSCISCASSYLTECPRGRNGVVCAGNGACVLRGCECHAGWSGGDCSTPASASVVSSSSSSSSSAAAVLYFPSDQSRVIRTRSPMASSFEIRVKRAGSLVGELRAKIQVKTSNASAVPASLFPASVTVASGASEAILTFTTAQFASSVVGSNCRALVLELVSDAAATMLATDSADRTMSLLFDDQNGPSGGGSQPRSVAAQYSVATNDASVVLDRVVATKLKLQPPTSPTVALRRLPLHFRVALENSSSETTGFADLLPATVAAIQAAYGSAATVRMGLLVANNSSAPLSSSSRIYQPLASFFTATQGLNSTTAAITWRWLAERLAESNATQWAAEDLTLRRFLLVFASAASLSGDASLFATALRQSATFAFVVLPPGQSLVSPPPTIPSDAIQIVTLPSSITEAPQRIADALRVRDSTTATSATVLSDPHSLVEATTPVTVSTTDQLQLPNAELTLAAMPSSITKSTLRMAVPGYLVLNVTLQEPGASCAELPSPDSLLPFDDQPLSGWIGAWHLLTDAEWNRQWRVPANSNPKITISQRRFNDSSLLRTARTSVVAMTPSGSSSRRVTLVRSFDGSAVAPGLGLVAKGYVRLGAGAGGSASTGVSCALRLRLMPADTNSSSIEASQAATASVDWQYLHFSMAVPLEVATMELHMDCNTTVSAPTVEWTSLGLFPDPLTACQCPRGFFYDSGVCVRCPAGSYCVAGIKRECPRGYFSFGKAASCEKCRDGWICVDGLVRLCQAGTYASPQSSCAICPSGYACRNGKKSICPAGTFSLAQASDCQLCPPGTISTTDGSSTCSLCALGSTSNFDRDHCVSCVAGETTTRLGQHACASCAATAFTSRRLPEICLAR